MGLKINTINLSKNHLEGLNLESKYTKNFIKKIIIRVDFNETPLSFEKGLPTSLTKKALEMFPISDPRPFIYKDIKITAQEDKINKIEGIEWRYHGKTRGKTLCISHDFVYIEYKKYESIDLINGTFLAILEELFIMNPDLQINRFGLRYINQINLEDSTHPTEWEGFINKNLIDSFNIIEDRTRILRAFHLMDLDYSDMRILFQYGMNNPDHPAPIKKKVFILDYDASVEGLQTKDDIGLNIPKFYANIFRLFDISIDDKLREILNA